MDGKKRTIDINTWKRKEHYYYFKDYQEPFFGITANVDCTQAYKYTKEYHLSFFLYYMYQSLAAVNAIEGFRYRIESDQVVCYDKIHGSTTALNADHLFAFAFLPYMDRFEDFYDYGKKEIAKLRTISGLNVCEDSSRPNVVHYSTIPWISFTALTQERNLAVPDSIPKITFGKYFKEREKIMLPVSVHVHHGLVDGCHVGQYFEIFQQRLSY